MSQLDAFPEARVDPTEDPNRRYTTRTTMDWCMKKADVDGWDLDVAADDESHWADRWYGIQQNGLKQPWNGRRVWCNPPFDDIEAWISMAWSEWETQTWGVGLEIEKLAMLLPANRTEQPWWQDHVEPFRDDNYPVQELRTFFLPGRTSYAHPGNPKGPTGSPPFASVLLVWSRE